MKHQTVTTENGTTYSYDIHSTKIYAADKERIKQLKKEIGLKSEYEVINLLLEYFTEKDGKTINQLKKENTEQKEKVSMIRQEVMSKLAQL